MIRNNSIVEFTLSFDGVVDSRGRKTSIGSLEMK
jgi:hypothetical protein